MRSKRNKRHNLPSDHLILPPPERKQHDLIERMDKAIADDPARPYKSVDILTRMERRGSITAGMRKAGEDFRNAFRRAHIDTLGAVDLSRPFIDSGHRARNGHSDSSDKVWRAILHVGGLGSAAGSCLWHVIGFEHTLKAWALEQGWNGRRVSQEAAYGILIAALGVLESYYATTKRRER